MNQLSEFGNTVTTINSDIRYKSTSKAFHIYELDEAFTFRGMNLITAYPKNNQILVFCLQRVLFHWNYFFWVDHKYWSNSAETLSLFFLVFFFAGTAHVFENVHKCISYLYSLYHVLYDGRAKVTLRSYLIRRTLTRTNSNENITILMKFSFSNRGVSADARLLEKSSWEEHTLIRYWLGSVGSALLEV